LAVDAAPIGYALRFRHARWDEDLDGEDRAFAQVGANADLMTQQNPQASNDGEPEAEAAAPFTRGVIELMVFLENRLKFRIGDAHPGVPDLDAQHSFAPTATEQHFAVLGIFQGVRKQVADHLLEQTRIAAYRKAARDYMQFKPLCLGVIAKLIPQPVE
jgi:hypothetical protein